MGDEGQHPDRRREGEADPDPLEHGGRSVLEPQILQEEDDLETFAVDGRESQQDEAGRSNPPPAPGQQPPATAVVVSDPARPVDAVKEPVHDQQQHDDRQQTGGRLDIEAGTAERADDPHGTEPGDDRGGNADPDAEPDRAALARVGAEEACVIAATTRIASRPSRKTSTRCSRTTAPWLRWLGAVGPGPRPARSARCREAGRPRSGPAPPTRGVRIHGRPMSRGSQCSELGHPNTLIGSPKPSRPQRTGPE